MDIGILGFAHGHVNLYCQRWRENPDWGVRVVAGWDHDPSRAETAQQQFGIALYDSPEALLARAAVGAVVVTAETSLHADLVRQAAAAGKAIVLQKPMALTVAEADSMIAAVERAGVPFTMAWQMRVDPQNIQMKALLDSGTLGRIYMIRRRHGLATHLWPGGFENLWHAQRALNRDIWADDAAHPVDLLFWWLGEPESVTAEIVSLHSPQVPNDNGIAVFRYPDGPLAEVVCSFTCLAGENTTEIVAEKGVVIQNYGDAPSCGAPRPERAVGLKWLLHGQSQWTASEIPSPASHGERIAALAHPLAEFLHGKRPAIATAHDGRAALRMTLACLQAAQEGRRLPYRKFVDLPL